MTERNADRAGRREWIALAVISLPCMLYAMDLTVLNLAVPALSRDLRPSSAQLLWIIDVYGFLVAGSLITMGTLGDRIGRRRLLLIGATAFGLVSVLAAFSRSAGMLIAARALLGLAGATVAPSTVSLIRNLFHDPRQRTAAAGLWLTSYTVGGAIGPFLGGLLLQSFWWGSVFLLAVPVMLLVLALGPRLLPEFRDPQAGRLDLVSASMSLAAVLLVILGLKQIAEDGLRWLPALSIAAGLVIGLQFLRRQRTLHGGAGRLHARHVRGVRGLRFRGPVLRRLGPRTVLLAGLAMAAIGLLMLTRVDAASGLALLVSGTFVYSLGLSPVFTLTNDLIIGSAPPARAGSAAAISETGSELGGALGIAILGSIGTALYRSRLAGASLDGVPADALQAARSTLGGAVAVAERLPADLAAALLSPAREAFTRALQVNAAVGVAVVVGMAIAIAAVTRASLAPGVVAVGDSELAPRQENAPSDRSDT